MNPITRRLAAVAFADIAGWTHWIETDEVAALHAWHRLLAERIKPAIQAHGGRLIDTAGDAVLVEFGSAVDAVAWALQLQHAAQPETRPPLRLRIGLNVGDLLVDGERLVGDEVNIASRLHQLAAPGEIVATEAVRQHVQQRVAVRFHDLGERDLKNVHRPIRVFRVEDADASPARATEVAEPGGKRALLALDLPQTARRSGEQRIKELIERLLPRSGGRLLRHDTQGMLLAFADARPALAVAFALREASGAQRLPGIGVQMAEPLADAHDLYGGGADMAVRLGRLAGPDGVVVSASVRNRLTPALDADIEDLGERYVDGMTQPVRAYRVEPPGTQADRDIAPAGDDELRPTVAVIPFAERGDGQGPIGEILAEAVIAALSRSAELNVVSRLSTTVFRGRAETLAEVGAHLRAQYVLSGAYRTCGAGIVLAAELADTRSGRVAWAGELKGRVAGIVDGRDELIDRLVERTGEAVIARELERTRAHSLQSLQTCTLLISGITLLHRLSPADFGRARDMLQAVVQRVPHHPVPLAWLAQWHVLRVWQGWSDDVAADTRSAVECGRRALDNDSHCPLALACDGFTQVNLLKALDVGAQRYDLALQLNPSESLAWLLRGALHAFKGEGRPALRCAQRSLRLSPLDPHRYFYDALAASAEVSAGRYDRAIVRAQRSLRANRMHASSFRVLAVAQWLSGQHDAARATAAELMRIQPQLTVSGWLRSAPSADYPIGKQFAEALRGAGVPT